MVGMRDWDVLGCLLIYVMCLVSGLMQVVPVDGHLHYNGDCQKSLEEMLQEMAISQ